MSAYVEWKERQRQRLLEEEAEKQNIFCSIRDEIFTKYLYKSLDEEDLNEVRKLFISLNEKMLHSKSTIKKTSKWISWCGDPKSGDKISYKSLSIAGSNGTRMKNEESVKEFVARLMETEEEIQVKYDIQTIKRNCKYYFEKEDIKYKFDDETGFIIIL